MRRDAEVDAWAQQMALIFGHDLAVTPSVVSQQVTAYRAYDATPRLGELQRIPTLVVSGSKDALGPPALGRALAAAISGARYHEISGGSHGSTVTHAKEYNTVLADHFRAAESRSRA